MQQRSPIVTLKTLYLTANSFNSHFRVFLVQESELNAGFSDFKLEIWRFSDVYCTQFSSFNFFLLIEQFILFIRLFSFSFKLGFRIGVTA